MVYYSALEIFNEFIQGILQYARNGYADLDIWFYPIIFVGIFGFIYAGTQSVTVMIVGILVTFGLYGSTLFVEIPVINNFFYLITIIGIVMLIVALMTKKIK
jgi:hypothetical protein